MHALAAALKAAAARTSRARNSAEFAMELLRFPIRQVVRRRVRGPGNDAFVATITGLKMVDRFSLAQTVLGGTHDLDDEDDSRDPDEQDTMSDLTGDQLQAAIVSPRYAALTQLGKAVGDIPPLGLHAAARATAARARGRQRARRARR